jgi:hypothetical protein
VRHIQAGENLDSKEKITTAEKIRSDGSDFDESIEKCDRRQPLVQILHSSPKLPHQSQHNDGYGDVLTQGEMDRSPANYRAKRSRYVFLPTDSGETHSHSDLPSVQVASTGGDFETESYLHHPAFSEEQTSSDLVEKHIYESSERECSESETEDDAELLQCMCSHHANTSFNFYLYTRGFTLRKMLPYYCCCIRFKQFISYSIASK